MNARYFILTATLVLTAGAVEGQTLSAPAAQPEWDIRCGPSPVEVAIDCVAKLATGNLLVSLEKSGGQLRLSLDRIRCGMAQRNYDRETLLAMTETARRQLMAKAFQEMATETARNCAQPTSFDFDLNHLPDLAVFPLDSER